MVEQHGMAELLSRWLQACGEQARCLGGNGAAPDLQGADHRSVAAPANAGRAGAGLFEQRQLPEAGGLPRRDPVDGASLIGTASEELADAAEISQVKATCGSQQAAGIAQLGTVDEVERVSRARISRHDRILIVVGAAHPEAAEESGEHRVAQIAREATRRDRHFHRPLRLLAVAGQEGHERRAMLGRGRDDGAVAIAHIRFAEPEIGNADAQFVGVDAIQFIGAEGGFAVGGIGETIVLEDKIAGSVEAHAGGIAHPGGDGLGRIDDQAVATIANQQPLNRIGNHLRRREDNVAETAQTDRERGVGGLILEERAEVEIQLHHPGQ